MTPRSSKRAAAIISERDDEHSRAEQSPRKESDFNVTVLQVSPSKRIVMSADGTVTLLDKLATTVVSTSENRETKILALESIYGLLRQNDERDLHPNCESPVVAQIIRTFKCKKDCLDAIDRCCFVAEHRQVLRGWTNDTWEEYEGGIADRNAEKEPDSPAGSLFSDSDVKELPTTRVRPITLRPRRTLEHEIPVKIKSEFKSEKLSSSAPSKSIARTSPLLPRSRQSPPPARVGERSPLRLQQTSVRPSLRNTRTNSAPSLRQKTSRISLRDEYHLDSAKKRPHLASENAPPEDRHIKRIKSHDAIPLAKSPAAIRIPSNRKAGPKKSAEKASLPEALNPASKGNGFSVAETRESNAEYVARYWKVAASQFPEQVREFSTIDRLAYYFRETDLMRKELQIIKRDEAERRKSMLLMAEKIKLMNQPTSRGIVHPEKGN